MVVLKRTVDVGFKGGFKPRFWLSLTQSNDLPSQKFIGPTHTKGTFPEAIVRRKQEHKYFELTFASLFTWIKKTQSHPNKSPCSQLPCEGSRTATDSQETWNLCETLSSDYYTHMGGVRDTYRAGGKRRTGRVGALWAVHTCEHTEGVSSVRLSLEKFQHIPLTQSPRQEPAFDLYVFNISAEILKP